MKLRYNGTFGPSVRAGGVNDWRTGETHEIKHDGVAKSLMQSGRFEDVTPAAAKAETTFSPNMIDDEEALNG